MIRFLHTGDLQLGMGFGAFPADRRPLLQRVRFDCLQGLGEAVLRAGHTRPDFVVIAGDFFDAPTVTDEVVIDACARVRALGLPTYVLPGNHDFVESGVYRRAAFRAHAPENLRVLDSTEPMLVAEGAMLLPAPLRYRRTAEDPTAHWSPTLGADLAPGAIRIGVAHGSVIDFSQSEAGADSSNVIDPARAGAAALDYLALGDWHGQKQIDARTWYAGAPEPTSFRDNDQGRALLVEIDAPGARPRVHPIDTGRYVWVQRDASVHAAEHVGALEAWFDALPRRSDTVLALTVAGALPIEEAGRLERLVVRMAAEVLAARTDTNGVVSIVGDAELDEIAVDGYVRAAVERLRARAAEDTPERDACTRALSLLHHLCWSEAR